MKKMIFAKMKSKKSATKRMKTNGAETVIKVSIKGKSHCLSNKNRKRKRRLAKIGHLSGQSFVRAKLLIPYC